MSNSTFAASALSLAALNLRVIPILPREKKAFLDAWEDQATSDAVVIQAWDEQFPNYNIAVVAKRIIGELCILEFDQGTLEEVAKECGQPVPCTRTVTSGNGGKHWYFTHIGESVELGNCQAAKNGHEWWSFRADNRYCVAPSSVHPNGNVYTFDNDNPIVPIPVWLVEWLEKNATSKKAAPKGAVEVHEDFDFDEWSEHYGFDYVGTKDQYWHILDECPGVGRRHEQSTVTGVYYDGSTLGFHCFAGGCPLCDKSIGQVMKWLHDNGHESYKGVIWEEQETIDELISEFATDAEDPTNARLDEEAAIVRLDEETDYIAGNHHEYTSAEPKAVGESSLGSWIIAKDSGQAGDSKPEVPAVQTTENVAAVPAPNEDPLKFPDECLYGKLGEWARQMKMPFGLGYPALIASHAMKPTVDRMCGTRINVYCALIAKPEGGKNQAIERAIAMTELRSNLDYMKATPGGDAQLAALLGDKSCGKKGSKVRIPGPRKMGLVNGEMTDMLKKTSIDNSVLASKMCNLWDDNEDIKPTKDGYITINCRVSWLGGIPADIEHPERFGELFSSESNYGLHPRFIFGYSGVAFNYRHWERPSQFDNSVLELDEAFEEVTKQHNGGVTIVSSISAEAQGLYDGWNPAVTSIGRLRQNLMKVALLTASANGEKEVTADCMSKAIIFMNWQLKIREIFKPSEAEAGNKEAVFTNLLLPALEQKGALTEFVSWRRISLDRKWDRKIDAGLQYRTVENLIKLGRLIQEEIPDEGDAKGKKTKKTMKVKIRK
jgi:hypothetical protein